MSGMPGIRLKFRIGSSSNLGSVLPGELIILSNDGSIRINTTQTPLSASNLSLLIGSIGSTGAIGAQGLQGHTGAQGTVGDRGFTGERGAEGFAGSTGSQGETGATGAKGSTGETGAQGITGAQGLTGTQGIQGETGSQGATGFTGAQGQTGFTGAQGTLGSTGAQGSTGSAGAQGFAGATGATGNTGAQGLTGSTGAQGFLGSTGTQGLLGSTGSQGSTGAEGSTGLPGVQGSTGFTGVQGSTGAQGSTGVTGAQGSTGATGAQGSTGMQGATGSSGAQGNTGAQGSQGYTGLQGNQGFTGSTGLQGFTGAQGSTGSTGLLGFTGSEGATGSTGAQGFTGSQGAQGYTGSTGAQGDTGAQGFTGSTGAQGSTGVTGVQGHTGTQGSTGSTGAQGWTGTQGETGATGAEGHTGAQGSTGSTGAQGFTGSTGTQGSTGAQGVTGWTGAQGTTGSQGSTGWTGAQGSTGFTGTQGATGAQGSTGSTGAQGFTGSTGAQGATGAQGSRGWTGAQGFIGSTGFVGHTGAAGLAGAAGAAVSTPLTNQTAYTVGSAGGAFTYNSNISFSSNTLTVTHAVTSNLSAVTMISQPTSVIPITYLTSSNAGIARSLYMIKNSPSSFALIPDSPISAYVSNIMINQLIVHPSGWVYAYRDSFNGTASNYIYIGALSNLASGLTLSNFGSAVNHMAVDPLGSIFISYNTTSNILKYTVNTSTGALTQVSTLVAPFAQGKVHATTGYLYVYLSGTTSNIYKYYNIPGSIGSLVATFTSNIYGNDGTLRFLSANANDTVLYATTSTSNLYSYSLQYSTATKIESNLAALPHTPSVDSYANALYTSLTNSNIVRITALDGSYSSNVNVSLPILTNPQSIVYNSRDSNLYFVSSNTIHKRSSTGRLSLFAGSTTSSGSTDATGSAARFNSPSQICLDPSGSNLYVADTGNNSIRQIVISTAAVTTAKTSLTTIRGLACDSSNFYFSLANSTIQRTTITGGTTSAAVTVVGLANTSGSIDDTGTAARVGNNCSLYFDSIYVNLYVADTANFTLRILNKVSTTIKTVYGTAGQSGDTSTNINTVRGLTFGTDGVLTFADSGVNKIKSTSSPITNAATLTNLYSTSSISPGGLVLQSESPITSSIVYCLDRNAQLSNQFYSMDLSTSNQPTLFANITGQGNFSATILCVDNKSNFYFNHTLGLCSYNYGTLVFSNLSSNLNLSQPKPNTLTIDSTFSNLYYFANSVLYKYDLSTRTNTAIAGSNGVTGYIDATGSNARFGQFLSRMCVDSSNIFAYVYEDSFFTLRKIQLSTGTVSTFAGSNGIAGMVDGVGGNARLRGIGGMHFGKSGLIYFIDDYTAFSDGPTRRNVLRIANPITSNITCITPSTIQLLPAFASERITLNESETIMYTINYLPQLTATALPRSIQTLAGSGTAGSNNATGLSATFNAPQGITFNGSNLIVADTGNNAFRQITPSYVVTSFTDLTVPLNNPQTVSLYSNSLYTVMNSNTTSAIVQIPLTYPSTTFTFSNVGSNVQVQNATGRQVTIAVSGGTVTNSNLPSVANISDVKTLYNTTGTTYTLL